MNPLLQNKKLINVIISAVLALAFVNFYIGSKERNMEDSFGMVDVLVAARDIPERAALNTDYVTSQRVPQRYLQPGAILVKIPSDAQKKIANKESAISLPEGTQITETAIRDPNTIHPSVATYIPPGRRGYFLKLANLDVAKLVAPGDYVDVLATVQVGGSDQPTKVTKTILQNIKVVAVDKTINPEDLKKESSDKQEAYNITLAVTPEEAERLTLASEQSQGAINIVIRGRGDSQVGAVRVMTPQELFQPSR